MTTTQRQRPSRQAPPNPDPASRGLILVAVAVVLGVILLIKGGGVGFDPDNAELEIGTDGGETPAAVESTTTTAAPPETSVPPAQLKIVALNAAGIDGYAGQAQQFLSVAGYTSVTPITAAAPAETTTVYFAPGFEVDAMMVASLFQLQPNQVQPLPADASLARDPAEFPADTNLAVVLGPDVTATVQGAAANNPPEGEGETGGEGAEAGTGAGT